MYFILSFAVPFAFTRSSDTRTGKLPGKNIILYHIIPYAHGLRHMEFGLLYRLKPMHRQSCV